MEEVLVEDGLGEPLGHRPPCSILDLAPLCCAWEGRAGAQAGTRSKYTILWERNRETDRQTERQRERSTWIGERDREGGGWVSVVVVLVVVVVVVVVGRERERERE